VTGEIDYRSPGAMTDLADVDLNVLVGLSQDPVGICRPVHQLVIQPDDAQALGLSSDRLATNQLRSAAELVGALTALDPAPVTAARAPEQRIVGTCRHFAVLACALLRRQAVSARVRCGFATYFQPGQGVDHWIVEYLDDPGHRWVRLDPEILEGGVLARPDDLPPGSFLSGGEAWVAFRSGGIDASSFGVYRTDNWGAAEIRGNAVKDLAALNKVEMLPWDEWGRMSAAYRGETGPDYDDLLDNLAAACNADDSRAIASLYRHPDLRVPEALLT